MGILSYLKQERSYLIGDNIIARMSRTRRREFLCEFSPGLKAWTKRVRKQPKRTASEKRKPVMKIHDRLFVTHLV